MKKVAIVGVEGSGKTVLMAAMGDKYRSPDANGVFLKPVNRQTYAYCTKEVAMLRAGKWPLATENSVTELDWKLMLQTRSKEDHEEVCQLSFLDFGGEIYRRAFGDRDQSELEDEDEQRKSAVERLRTHVREADVLMVLVNLSDIINGSATDERTIEMNWLSQAILSFAYDSASKRNVALIFTQSDTYGETITRYGGVEGTLRKYLSEVDASYGNRLAVFEVAAVNKTMPSPDDSGLSMPAPDFTSEGLEKVLAWIVGRLKKDIDIGRRKDFMLKAKKFGKRAGIACAALVAISAAIALIVVFGGRSGSSAGASSSSQAQSASQISSGTPTPSDSAPSCSLCNGTGLRKCTRAGSFPGSYPMMGVHVQRCTSCGGAGFMPSPYGPLPCVCVSGQVLCPECGGSGNVVCRH